MSGRYTLHQPEQIAKRFDVRVTPELKPRFNIAPSQIVPVIRQVGARRELVGCKWGLVPEWAKDPAIGNKLINAQAETLASKLSFKHALANGRCLIPADGFYAWLIVGKERERRPYYFRLRDKGLFAFAGLWDTWIEPGSGRPLETCTIITVEPNKLVAQVQGRMPAMLLPEEETTWIGPNSKPADVLSLLKPYPVERMELVRISRKVNSASAEGPELIVPVAK